MTNEWMWAICSVCSGQMSDCEQIAQDKRASFSVFWVNHSFFSLLTKNERLAKKLRIFCTFLQFSGNFFLKSKRFAHSLWVKWANCSGRSGQMSDREQLTHFAQREWAIVSKSLTSLRGNEQSWTNHSGRSSKMSESLVFFSKKRVIHSENWWVYTQPCFFVWIYKYSEWCTFPGLWWRVQMAMWLEHQAITRLR